MSRRGIFCRGGLRWLMTMLTVIAVTVWLGFAFFWEASAVGAPGWARLLHGCLEVEWGLRPPLPPNFKVATLLPYPPSGMQNVRCGRATEPRLDWALDFRYGLSSAGPVTSSGGPQPVLSVASAMVWRTVIIPLWPLVLLFAALAFMSWRRYRRRVPGECGGCGYDRRGLAADAKCPECGTVPAS